MPTLLIYTLVFGITLAVSLSAKLVSAKSPLWLSILLSFSGAFLLGITLLHVIPELYAEQDFIFVIGVSVLTGFFIQVILESYSQGIEHGHIHVHRHSSKPFGLFLALSMHAFLEGGALNATSFQKVLIAILVHKIPVAFLLGVLLFSLSKPTLKIYAMLVIFAISTPLGGIVSSNLNTILIVNVPLTTILMGLAAGSFLHVSTTILFETSPEHNLRINKFLPALVGGIFSILLSLL